MGQPRERKAQIYNAPGRPEISAGKTSFFLAGTTAGEDWRSSLINSVLHLPIIIFNPLRRDWGSSWREDATFGPFREQVEWELEMQEKADVIVLYFGPGTDAPVSLLELGLCARSGKAVVACHKDYKKRGNVQILCWRFGIELVEMVDDLAACVVRKVASWLGLGAGGWTMVCGEAGSRSSMAADVLPSVCIRAW